MVKISNFILMGNCDPIPTEVILELAGACNYSRTELASHLEKDEGQISKTVGKLRNKLLVYVDQARPRKDPKTGKFSGRRTDFPIYLTRELSFARNLTDELLSAIREFLQFQPEELEYPYTFASVLSDSDNPIASFLRERLSPNTKQQLYDLKNRHDLPKSLKTDLVNELNRIIQGEPFYNEQLFQNVLLRLGTKKFIIIIHDLQENEKLLFNRLLLEDAFPFLIRKKAAIQLFSKFIKCLIQEGKYAQLKQFLGSKYINNLIEKDGFFSIYRIIEEDLSQLHVRIAASALLDSEAVKRQFRDVFEAEKNYELEYFAGFTPNKDLSESINEFRSNEFMTKYFDFFPEFKADLVVQFDDFSAILSKMELKNLLDDNKDFRGDVLDKMHYYSTPWKNMRLEVLSKFDPLSTVRFYRNNIVKILSNLYQELRDRNLITKGLQEFLEHDTYLSPLTSYPFNDYENLIFAPARIFEDVYLLDKADREVLIARARAIYDNFADLLLDRQRAIMRFALSGESNELDDVYRVQPVEDLKAETRAFIFYWNAVSTTFDDIIFYIDHFYDDGSGNYHLVSDGINFNIIDLEKIKPLLASRDSKLVTLNGILPREIGSSRVMKNPLEYLRPCKCFGLKSKKEADLITFEQIFSDFQSKLAEEVERGMPLRLDRGS